ncbi:MAG TPA: YceI family protein [Actinomycetes bacterium]|nr:YceI family protein [Actinomycetes bacterium]
MTTTARTSLTGTYLLDPARTRLGFVARQLGVAKVRGKFAAFAGGIQLHFADPARSSAEVTVDVDSLTTGNSRRDEHLRRHFFDAAVHPRITFRSTAVDVLAADRARVTGDLTVRGTTRPLTIAVVRTGALIDSEGSSRVHLRGRATLDRRDWDVTWRAAVEGGGAFVSNRVAIELDAVAVRAHGPLVG